MPTPVSGTFPAFTEKYVNLVKADTVKEMIEKYAAGINQFFVDIPEQKHAYRYGPDKWTIKTVVSHLSDAERIFAYRALRLSRFDQNPLPGFDENNYAAASNADERTWHHLLEEFFAVRRSTDLLYASFNAKQLEQTGTTGNAPNSVNAICYITYGHLLHHINILKERYL